MLTEDEKTKIQHEIEQSDIPGQPLRRSPQGSFRHATGWVSDEDIRELAPLLGMTPDELDAVATFYPFIFRRPVGRHVIFVCDSVSCWVMGYESLLTRLKERLGIAMGETTPDGRFTLLPVSCIGACDRAPAMMIDRDLHVDLDPEKIDTISRTIHVGGTPWNARSPAISALTASRLASGNTSAQADTGPFARRFAK